MKRISLIKSCIQKAFIGCVVFTFLNSLSIAGVSTYYLDNSRLELEVSPKTNTASGSVKVTSSTDHVIKLKVVPKLWTLSSDGAIIYVEPPAGSFNLIGNIGVNPTEFELLPGKSKLVRFVVRLPDDAKNAEYPFQLYFEPTDVLSSEQLKQPNSAVKGILDVIPVFTTTVYAYKGSPSPEVSTEQFNCQYSEASGQLKVNLTLKNQGAKHARLTGNVVVVKKDGAGNLKPIDAFRLNNSGLLVILPNTMRILQQSFTSQNLQKLSPGDYQIELQLVDERNIQPALRSYVNFSVKDPGQ